MLFQARNFYGIYEPCFRSYKGEPFFPECRYGFSYGNRFIVFISDLMRFSQREPP